MPANAELKKISDIEVGLLKKTGFNAELAVTSLTQKYHQNQILCYSFLLLSLHMQIFLVNN